jgi:hypothetical protein
MLSRKIITLLIGLGLLILLVVGCSPRAVPSTTTDTKTVVRDSIIVKEVPRIVEVKVPGETVVVKEFIECDSTTNKPKPKVIKARHGNAFVKVKIESDGSATATGGCDSLQALVEVKDKEILHLKEKLTEKSKTETKVITQKKTRTIDIFCRCFTGIVLSIILLVLISKLKKFLPF